MEELSSHSYLKDNVDVGGIFEAAVHLDDIGMVEEHLYLDLA